MAHLGLGQAVQGIIFKCLRQIVEQVAAALDVPHFIVGVAEVLDLLLHPAVVPGGVAEEKPAAALGEALLSMAAVSQVLGQEPTFRVNAGGLVEGGSGLAAFVDLLQITADVVEVFHGERRGGVAGAVRVGHLAKATGAVIDEAGGVARSFDVGDAVAQTAEVGGVIACRTDERGGDIGAVSAFQGLPVELADT